MREGPQKMGESRGVTSPNGDVEHPTGELGGGPVAARVMQADGQIHSCDLGRFKASPPF